MADIIPIRGRFENLAAMLAAMADDASNIGFVGALKRSDGTLEAVNFGVNRGDVAMAAAMMLQTSIQVEES